MKRETTPVKVTDKIRELCDGIISNVIPEYISVEVPKWSKPMECFFNVAQMVQKNGGQQVNGWIIWQWANILVEAEAHSVWKSPEGKLVDITPHDGEESQILFLRDDSLVFLEQSIPNIRLAITGSPLVAELIELSEVVDNIMCSYKPGTKIPIEELQNRLLLLRNRREYIVRQLDRKVGRNDICPCESGLKYKKCCGQ